MRHHGYKVYLKNFSNYYQWAMIFVNSTLSYSIVYGMKYDSHDNIDKTRIHMMYSIILNLIELFNRVRIFKFFAYFVRQLNANTYLTTSTFFYTHSRYGRRSLRVLLWEHDSDSRTLFPWFDAHHQLIIKQ